MKNIRHLLDVNVLLALLDRGHIHHPKVSNWFKAPGLDWGVCALTEAGFLRVASNPNAGGFTLQEAVEALDSLPNLPGYRYWPIDMSWTVLAAPFLQNVFGHQQITHAFLLGLAVKENGVLVTMDRAIRQMAEQQLGHHVLILE